MNDRLKFRWSNSIIIESNYNWIQIACLNFECATLLAKRFSLRTQSAEEPTWICQADCLSTDLWWPMNFQIGQLRMRLPAWECQKTLRILQREAHELCSQLHIFFYENFSRSHLSLCTAMSEVKIEIKTSSRFGNSEEEASDLRKETESLVSSRYDVPEQDGGCS